MRKGFVKSFDGAKIYYEADLDNSRIPFLFVHGLGGNLTAWKTLVSFFNKLGYSTIALDLRGHGLSDKFRPRQSFGMESFARDVFFVLKKEKVKKAYLIGHCFGGYVSLVFSYLYPEKVKKLVLINPLYRDVLTERIFFRNSMNKAVKILDLVSGKNISIRYRYPRIDYAGFRNEPYFYFFFHDLLGTPLQTYVHVMLASTTYDAEFIKKINVSSLILAGKSDVITPAGFSQKLAKAMAAGFRVIPGDHLAFIRDPRTAMEHIIGFIVGSGVK